MNKFIKSDPMLCIGCRTCMIACVVNHTGKNIFTMDPGQLRLHAARPDSNYERHDPACTVPSVPQTEMFGSLSFQGHLYGRGYGYP